MKTTFLLSLVLILALIILLFAAVVLIQDKRFFTTAPKDIQEAAIDHPERFPGAHALGWILAVGSLCMMIGAFVYGWMDGRDEARIRLPSVFHPVSHHAVSVEGI